MGFIGMELYMYLTKHNHKKKTKNNTLLNNFKLVSPLTYLMLLSLKTVDGRQYFTPAVR